MSSDPQQLTQDFSSNRPLYEAFTKSLCGALATIFESHELQVLPLEMRTKEVDSFEKKINKENKIGKYKSLSDITDLSGIRIISFLQQDCDAICDIIENSFEIDWSNSVRKTDELDADKFGYLSTHYVLSYDPVRLKVGEFKRFAGLKAEVQVRTILQHAWAAIDWKLRYKSKSEVPKELRRRLYRISALLEAADDDFSYVSARIDELRLQYGYQIDCGNFDIPLNAESLIEYFSKSRDMKELFDLAHALGFCLQWDAAAKIGTPALIFPTLEIMNIRTLEPINNAVRAFLQRAEQRLQDLAKYKNDNRNFALSGLIRFAILDNASTAVRKKVLQQVPFLSDYVNKFLLKT